MDEGSIATRLSDRGTVATNGQRRVVLWVMTEVSERIMICGVRAEEVEYVHRVRRLVDSPLRSAPALLYWAVVLWRLVGTVVTRWLRHEREPCMGGP